MFQSLLHLQSSKVVVLVGPAVESYGRHNPSAVTITKIDILQDKVVETISRIDTSRSKTEIRSVKERIMLLQFTLKFLEKYKCLLSVAVDNAVNFFCWRRHIRVGKDIP